MNRAALIAQVSDRLGDRNVVWAGIRGDDAEPLADLPQFAASYTIINAYTKRLSVDGIAYEDLSGVRVDLETWDIDQQLAAAPTATFRRGLLQALSVPSALLPYRPSNFLSAVWFARRDRCVNLGLFGGHQAAFEHKPWVETSLAALGLPAIPWTYVADEEQLRAADLLRSGAVMLRRSRTSGGEGIVRIDDPQDVAPQWPRAEEAFVSVAPYLDGGIPVNVGAVVWRDGVTLHHPSLQLIGVPSCVTRPFGYCGNDFGRARDLDRAVLHSIERSTSVIGEWLRSFGYRGAFGVDFLVHDGVALFTEINARFQGSTHASCRLSIEADESCLMLEHVAAMLDLPAPRSRSLVDLVEDSTPLAHLVVHWTGPTDARLDPSPLISAAVRARPGTRVEVATKPTLVTQRGAAVARIIGRDSLTSTGFDLAAPYAALVDDWNSAAIHGTQAGSIR